jgi:hypothetical protein
MRDLISASVAAISRYSPASSSCSSVISSMYCMYCLVISAMRDVEDVQVLAADQVQQQIERALEGLEEHLQRLWRDVEIPRHLGDGFAVHHRKGHLGLLGCATGAAASPQARSMRRSSDPAT